MPKFRNTASPAERRVLVHSVQKTVRLRSSCVETSSCLEEPRRNGNMWQKSFRCEAFHDGRGKMSSQIGSLATGTFHGASKHNHLVHLPHRPWTRQTPVCTVASCVRCMCTVAELNCCAGRCCDLPSRLQEKKWSGGCGRVRVPKWNTASPAERRVLVHSVEKTVR